MRRNQPLEGQAKRLKHGPRKKQLPSFRKGGGGKEPSEQRHREINTSGQERGVVSSRGSAPSSPQPCLPLLSSHSSTKRKACFPTQLVFLSSDEPGMTFHLPQRWRHKISLFFLPLSKRVLVESLSVADLPGESSCSSGNQPAKACLAPFVSHSTLVYCLQV